jgi:hypothetical protein
MLEDAEEFQNLHIVLLSDTNAPVSTPHARRECVKSTDIPDNASRRSDRSANPVYNSEHVCDLRAVTGE